MAEQLHPDEVKSLKELMQSRMTNATATHSDHVTLRVIRELERVRAVLKTQNEATQPQPKSTQEPYGFESGLVQLLNEARCLSKETVGNRELAGLVMKYIRMHWDAVTQSPAPARRTDAQIVEQTEALAKLLMSEFHQREPLEGKTFRDAIDPRARHCWLVACRVQELLTDTDPENAVAELEDAAEVVQAPAVGAQPQEVQDAAWRTWADAGTVGSLISFLATLDHAAPIVSAYHVTMGSGERRCKTHGLTISRERVDHATKTIRTADTSLPYTHVLWAQPPEPAGLSLTQEPKYTVNGHAIVNRASGEEIPADEPVFILRARDKRAASIIGEYAEMCNDPVHAQIVSDRFCEFGEWAEAHPERMKEPDTAPAASKPPVQESEL